MPKDGVRGKTEVYRSAEHQECHRLHEGMARHYFVGRMAVDDQESGVV